MLNGCKSSDMDFLPSSALTISNDASSLLEDFRVPRISVTDLKLTTQPWVCHGLKRLSVFFASDPVDPHADSLVFEQQSRLQWLESLDVSQQHEWFESIGVSQHHDSDVIWSPPIESTVLQTEIETGFGT
ncbi:hypothetical protein BGZ89_009455 [Linnemannia elongata]|nr:hypothetical protein BGZ89_009455 [Linnemannia elongata]